MRRHRQAVLTLALVGAAACSPHQPASVTAPASVVALANASNATSDPFASQFCGGVLSAPDTVLTAKHCVAGMKPDQIAVITGITDLCSQNRAGQETITVAAIHPTAHFDVVELRLRQPSSVRPAVISGQDSGPSNHLASYGWGRDQSWTPRCNLERHDLRTVSWDRCRAAGGPDTDQLLCALPTASSTNTCSGDSGSPVFDDAGTLQAIVTGGVGCGADDPGWYSKVAK